MYRYSSLNSIGYVEFRTIELVEKAIALSGTIVMGLPIMVQLTESERNKTHAGDGYVQILIQSLYLANALLQEPPPPSRSDSIPWCNVRILLSSMLPATNTPYSLYVGSLHFNLTESDIRQVFEPFGELEFVDLHRDPTTGRSKGYAFIQ